MFANRRVLVAVVAAFALIFALGVGWLVRTAAADDPTSTSADTSTSSSSSSSDSGSDTADGSVPQDDLALPDSESDTDTDTGQPDSGEGGEEPGTTDDNNEAPRPAKTVRVNGPQGGGAMEDSCRFFVNQFSVTMKVKKVFLNGADDGLYRAAGHCPLSTNPELPSGSKPCSTATRLDTSEGCYTGVQLEKELRRGDGENEGEPKKYEARVTVVFGGVCESANGAPCSEESVAREKPSGSRPVPVEWKATTEVLVVYGKSEAEKSSPSPSASASVSASASASASPSPET
ncbi:hypothetical protein OHA21_07515 [Actinoplanes sp. NBC_00393]|uniref:hypothetical protein n=1 Tax=Actinoplanes sp. NBC_00393 TaxID=2975953 RepID=UPI002E1DE964